MNKPKYLLEMASVLEDEEETYVSVVPFGIYDDYSVALETAEKVAKKEDKRGRRYPEQTMYIEYIIYETYSSNVLHERYVTPDLEEHLPLIRNTRLINEWKE